MKSFQFDKNMIMLKIIKYRKIILINHNRVQTVTLHTYVRDEEQYNYAINSAHRFRSWFSPTFKYASWTIYCH